MRIALSVLFCVAVWTSPSDAGDLSQATSNVHRSQDDHGNYKFGYNIEDGWGSSNGRWEVGDALGNKRGGYTITDADGRKRYVEYIADKNGFRVVVNTNEPGTAPSQSGSAITKPVETADKHEDENILQPIKSRYSQSLDHGSAEHLDSEPHGAAPLASPLDSPAAHVHHSDTGSHLQHLSHQHESQHHPHHSVTSHAESYPDDSNSVSSHDVSELPHQHILHHHHGDPDALASIGKPAFVHTQHQNTIAAKKLKVIAHQGAPIITNVAAPAPKTHIAPVVSVAPIPTPLVAEPIVHANYRAPIGLGPHTNAKEHHLPLAGPPGATHWSAKKEHYRQYLKKKYPAPLYSSGHQTALPRQITVEHPDPVDPKTLQTLLLSGAAPSFGAEKQIEQYIPQYPNSVHSLTPPASSSLLTSADVQQTVQPPPVKIVQPAALLSYQTAPFYSHLKSSTAVAQHGEAADPIVELKIHRPHEGKAYPIHLKASESAGIPKYAKIVKRTGFGFRRYDEHDQADSAESASDELHSVENHVRPSRRSPKSSSSESSEHRTSPISKAASRNIYSYY